MPSCLAPRLASEATHAAFARCVSPTRHDGARQCDCPLRACTPGMRPEHHAPFSASSLSLAVSCWPHAATHVRVPVEAQRGEWRQRTLPRRVVVHRRLSWRLAVRCLWRSPCKALHASSASDALGLRMRAGERRSRASGLPCACVSAPRRRRGRERRKKGSKAGLCCGTFLVGLGRTRRRRERTKLGESSAGCALHCVRWEQAHTHEREPGTKGQRLAQGSSRGRGRQAGPTRSLVGGRKVDQSVGCLFIETRGDRKRWSQEQAGRWASR